RPDLLLTALGEMGVEDTDGPAAHRGGDGRVTAVLRTAVRVLHRDGVRHRRRRENGLPELPRAPGHSPAAAPVAEHRPVLDVVVQAVQPLQVVPDSLDVAYAGLLQADDLGRVPGDLRRPVDVG